MRKLLLALVIALLPTGAARGADEDTATLIRRARTLRLNGYPEQALAILEPMLSGEPSTGEVVAQYIMSVCHPLRGEELKTKIDELEKRFGAVAAIYGVRAEHAAETSDDEALAEIERGLKAFPGSESLVALKGYFLADKDSKQAIAWLLEAAAKYPQNEVIHYHLGWAYNRELSEEDSAKALAAYQRASDLNPSWITPLTDMVQLQLRNRDCQAALNSVSRAEKLNPESLDVKWCKLQAVSMMENPPSKPEEVWSEIDAILEKRGRTLADLRRTLFVARRREVHDRQRADALRDEIIRRFPDSPDAANERRKTRFEAATKLLSEGRWVEAEAALRELLAEAKEPREKAWILDLLTRAVRDDRAKLLPALDQYAAALEKAPPTGNIQAPLRLARLYLSVDQYDKARQWVQRGKQSFAAPDAIRPLPAQIKIQLEREADSLLADICIQSGQLDEAKRILTPLLEDKDWAANAHGSLAQIAIQEKDWTTAEKHLDTAFKQTFLGKEVEGDLKKLYVARTGSEEGWDKHIAALKESARGALRDEAVKMFAIEPKPVPAFELERLGGPGKASNKDTAGKVAIFSLWASWCGPCVQEMPEFQRFYDKHSKDVGLSIWSVNAEEPPATARKFLQGKPYTFPVLLDPKAFDRFGIDGIPSIFVADASGRLRFHMTGYDPDADFVQLLEWLVEAAAAQQVKP